MENHCILISGPTIAKDKALVKELQKGAAVLKNLDNSQLEAMIRKQPVGLVLFEISPDRTSDLQVIKKVKTVFPRVAIILIDGDRELMAKAFSYGATDAFKKPYKSSLIAERVSSLLGEQ